MSAPSLSVSHECLHRNGTVDQPACELGRRVPSDCSVDGRHISCSAFVSLVDQPPVWHPRVHSPARLAADRLAEMAQALVGRVHQVLEDVETSDEEQHLLLGILMEAKCQLADMVVLLHVMAARDEASFRPKEAL